MSPKDRACFNCKAGVRVKVPIIKHNRIAESAYWGLIGCRQQLSDHYKHYVELTHICSWHSDFLQLDERYPHWKESIDLPEK